MSDQIFIQHRFSDDVTVNGSTIHYEDAIVLPEDDYNKLSQADIDAQKAQRVANFKNILENPPKPVEVPPEKQLQDTNDQIQALTDQLDQLTTQKATLETTLGIVDVQPIDVTPVVIGGK